MKQNADDRVTQSTGSSPSNSGRDHLLATLKLGFERDQDTTRLILRDHFGPLLVQKPLYPEHPSICHAIVVHPPGGVVGGDELQISARAGKNAHVFLSTPGAAKWYRANGHISRQQLTLDVADQAVLEWLPQETILFNGADIVLDTNITLNGQATYIGCEILCFGRTASGEKFDHGRVRQRLVIHRDGKPLWLEQGSLDGSSKQMISPLALDGYTVCANLIAVGATAPANILQAIRSAIGEASIGTGKFGATQMKSVTIVRYLGHSSEVARAVMLAAWKICRPALTGQPAVVPRIWNT
jgi:urease accessory protein